MGMLVRSVGRSFVCVCFFVSLLASMLYTSSRNCSFAGLFDCLFDCECLIVCSYVCVLSSFVLPFFHWFACVFLFDCLFV